MAFDLICSGSFDMPFLQPLCSGQDRNEPKLLLGRGGGTQSIAIYSIRLDSYE